MDMYIELYQAITMIMVLFCICTLIVVVAAILLKRHTDKIVAKYEQDYQNSLNILSETKTNDNGCNIGKVFDDLEKNNIDISCNTKID